MRLLLAATLSICVFSAQGQNLRIGLAEDPDSLDPTLARTFVGRVVFAGLCDKLFDLDEKLNILPMLATGHDWSADGKALTLKLRAGVTFHDGEKLDAAAVKFNLERQKNLPGSSRRAELAPVASVDVVDPQTVRLNLSAPAAPLLAVLADRAGMMVSPKAAQAAGDKFGSKPVCSGPLRSAERIAQDRIVLERYPGYWDKARIHFERVTCLPIVDSTVRLANLRAGQLDLIERMAGSDVPQVKSDSRFRVAKVVEIGYYGITINVAKSDLAQKHALGKDARVREAFELALDRDGVVQVAMDGEAVPGNQWVAPNNRYYAKKFPIPKRDLDRARALLKEAGVSNPSVTLMTPTSPDAQRIAQGVQAMGPQRQAVRLPHRARRHGARAGPENELRCPATSCGGWRRSCRRWCSSRCWCSGCSSCCPAIRRSSSRARTAIRLRSSTCARSCTSTSRCRCATPTGSAACCAAISANRCACRSRGWSWCWRSCR